MKHLLALSVLLGLFLAVTTPAMAGELITLKDGVTGTANIIDTTDDSITVSFVREGASVTLKLKAGQLDPYSFYEIRRDYMEHTAENHLRLGLFCIKEGMFARARYHVDEAKAIDPAFVEKVKAIPGLKDRIAEKILEHARRAYDADDMESAERLAIAVLTRFPESPAAVQAEALVTHMDDKEQVREAKRRAEVMAAATKAAGEADQAKAAERNKLLAPIYDRMDLARKMRAQGLREKNTSRARKALEAAGAEYEKTLEQIRNLSGTHAEDPALISVLALGDIQIREDAVSCYVSAGSIMIGRGSYPEAEKLARRAIAVDPKSEDALAFRVTVQTAAALGSRRTGLVR